MRIYLDVFSQVEARLPTACSLLLFIYMMTVLMGKGCRYLDQLTCTQNLSGFYAERHKKTKQKHQLKQHFL